MGRSIRAIDLSGPFRGSEAVAAGALTAAQLRGPAVRRVFQDVYVPAGIPDTQQVPVEYDGAWRNEQLWALNHDRDRLNRVPAAGWEVVFVTAPLLANPKQMVDTVRAALARR